MRALVVVDLGFGDAGKGLLTDFLVRHAGATVVVRYNGGAQAGHNVVAPDGRHHTFAQFGSGTFIPGVRTFLSCNVVIHPTALLREEAHLREIGVHDAFERLDISADALVITPFHQELNRLRELARGDERHGSCGVGIGEAVAHARATPDEAVRARDLADRALLRRKLQRIRDSAWEQARDLGGGEIFHRPDVMERWIESASPVASRVTGEDAWLQHEPEAVVFEGAQGVLLDEWHGFPPYTTWGSCTSAPARQLLAEFVPDADITTFGVLRTHVVRHGPGPLPTEHAAVKGISEHNTFNEWQRHVRYGWFDAVLARHAVDADGAIDALAITHLDWLQRLEQWTYRNPASALQSCAADEDEVLGRIEELVGKRVAFGSRGPSAAQVFGAPSAPRYVPP